MAVYSDEYWIDQNCSQNSNMSSGGFKANDGDWTCAEPT